MSITNEFLTDLKCFSPHKSIFFFHTTFIAILLKLFFRWNCVKCNYSFYFSLFTVSINFMIFFSGSKSVWKTNWKKLRSLFKYYFHCFKLNSYPMFSSTVKLLLAFQHVQRQILTWPLLTFTQFKIQENS